MTTLRVGTYEEDGRKHTVTVSIALERVSGPLTTVEHHTVPDAVRLAIQGQTTRGGSMVTAGQCIDELPLVTSFDPRWDAESVAELERIWRRWHLNDMRAGCAHQQPVGDTPSERLERTPRCAETEYRWGSAWLVEPLPSDVIEWAQALGVQVKPS